MVKVAKKKKKKTVKSAAFWGRKILQINASDLTQQAPSEIDLSIPLALNVANFPTYSKELTFIITV